MKIIQLKWSDEAGWKDFIPVFDKADPATLLEKVQAQWHADRQRFKLDYDAEFRVIDALIGSYSCELAYPRRSQP